MTIYIDKIAESLGLVPITKYYPEYKEEWPEDCKLGSFGFVGPHTDETKLLMSKNSKGENNNFYGKRHENTNVCASFGMLGKKHTDETKQKMSKSAIGKPGTNNGKKFGPRTEEQRKRISEATKLAMKTAKKKVYKKVQCPHCYKYGKGSNMSRYHFDNCKVRKELKHA